MRGRDVRTARVGEADAKTGSVAVLVVCSTIAVLGLVDVVFPRAFESVWFIQTLVRVWSRMLPFVIPWLLLLEFQKRRGESLHCPACDYEFVYGPEASLSHPDRCSECGHVWSDQLVKGRREASPKRVAVLVGCLLAGIMALAVYASREKAWMSRHAPTSLLLHHLASVSDPGAAELDAVWSELAQRTLDPAIEAKLVNQIVDRVRVNPLRTTSKQMQSWFEGVIQAGRVPQLVIDRYLDQRVSATLDVNLQNEGGPEVWLRIIDHDKDGYGDLRPVLARCWIEPSGSDIAKHDGWFGARFSYPVGDKVRGSLPLTFPGIAATHPSLRIPVPAEMLVTSGQNPVNGASPKIRATVWLFWSPQGSRSSRLPPDALVADPTRDPSIHLLRTVEIELEMSQRAR